VFKGTLTRVFAPIARVAFILALSRITLSLMGAASRAKRREKRRKMVINFIFPESFFDSILPLLF